MSGGSAAPAHPRGDWPRAAAGGAAVTRFGPPFGSFGDGDAPLSDLESSRSPSPCPPISIGGLVRQPAGHSHDEAATPARFPSACCGESQLATRCLRGSGNGGGNGRRSVLVTTGHRLAAQGSWRSRPGPGLQDRKAQLSRDLAREAAPLSRVLVIDSDSVAQKLSLRSGGRLLVVAVVALSGSDGCISPMSPRRLLLYSASSQIGLQGSLGWLVDSQWSLRGLRLGGFLRRHFPANHATRKPPRHSGRIGAREAPESVAGQPARAQGPSRPRPGPNCQCQVVQLLQWQCHCASAAKRPGQHLQIARCQTRNNK